MHSEKNEQNEVNLHLLGAKRNSDESYGDYCIRRKNEQNEVNLHLLGTVIKGVGSSSRKQRREVLSKTKHFGKQSKF